MAKEYYGLRSSSSDMSPSDHAEVERWSTVAAWYVIVARLPIARACELTREWFLEHPREMPAGITVDGERSNVLPMKRRSIP